MSCSDAREVPSHPACERGVRIETANLHHDGPGFDRHPACERGVRIETSSARVPARANFRHPACERGVRIETSPWIDVTAYGAVTPRANAGCGLKHRRID